MEKALELAKLTAQPFRLLPSERVTVWAGYRDIRERLLEVVESPRADEVGLYEFVILYGFLGSGKSHALRYLKYLITEKEKAKYRSIVVYIEQLAVAARTDFPALFRATMALLREELPRVGEVVDTFVDDQVEKAWAAQSDDVRRRIRKQDFREQELPSLYSKLSPQFPPLPRLLSAARAGDDGAVAILTRQKPKVDPSKYGLLGFIETQFDTVRCLAAFINLCTTPIEGVPDTPLYKCFYLFIDEVERLREMPTAEVRSINDGFRDLLNACPERFCLLLGATSDVAEIEAWTEDHVRARLTRDPIEIPELEPEQAVEFIKDIMRQYRQPSASVPDAYPFDEDALREISLSAPRRTARELFRRCHTVLQKATLSGRLEANGIITVADVKEFLE